MISPKHRIVMKNIGIWMDIQKAHIVTLTANNEEMQTLFSEVENFRPKGGSGTKLKGGPQDVVQDSKYLERRKNQMKRYFKNLAEAIKDADAVALFGPSDTAEKFRRELGETNKQLALKIRAVIKADSMTDNQTMALIRDFYNN